MDVSILRGWMQQLCAMSEAKLDALPGIPSKRAALIPSACGAMEALLERLAVNEVVFSVSGVREGALFRDVPPEVQQQDPLLSSAEYHAFLVGRHGAYGRALCDWMAPLLGGNQKNRLALAACLLSELAWTVDPNFRAEWVFWRVVQSSMKGLNHHERIQLALALYYRYSRKWKLPTADALIALLSAAERREAELVGLAMNLAFQLSGGHSENLADVPLRLHEGEVSIDFTRASAWLDSAVVQKRLDGLGVILSAFSS
jgi:exopolyphosphatase/guanosine-5'-triphosphate,3'-diphosphate pyrophosphatase